MTMRYGPVPMTTNTIPAAMSYWWPSPTSPITSRRDSALDKEALKRGNSAYFPDRVVPMLPEELSADLCSLKEGVDRPCLVARMVFDRHGRKKSHLFQRAIMRSAARLTYARAQGSL